MCNFILLIPFSMVFLVSTAVLPAASGGRKEKSAIEEKLKIPGKIDPKMDLKTLRLMFNDLARGRLKECQADEVIAWAAAPAEVIEGKRYQIGLATYRAETIFGERNVTIKALFVKGKIIGWRFQKSNLPVK